MNAIIGMSYLALESDLSAKQRNYIGKVHNSAQSLLGLLNDILDFSKVEAGKLDVNYTEFSLNSVLDDVSSLVIFKSQEKGIEFLIHVEKGVPDYILGDQMRLKQVLVNLCANAIKFTEKGEVKIRISVSEDLGEYSKLVFRVTDSGIGLSADQMKKLFQSFSQADPSTTRIYGGTGLGLAICKRLINLMGGEIEVRSELGQGAEFTFNLLVKKGNMQNDLRFHSVSKPVKKRVLVVDDCDSSRQIVIEHLEALKCRAESSPDYIGAEQHISRLTRSGEKYDLVLFDWNTPHRDAASDLGKLRDLLADFESKIVIMSIYSLEEVQLALDEHHLTCNTMLAKPFTSSSLYDAIISCYEIDRALHGKSSSLSKELNNRVSMLKGCRLLLVEDNALNTELAQDLLESYGFVVDTADNGQQAITMLAGQKYQGILMDCQMPIMDGYEATIYIRNTLHQNDLPIIAMTANVMSGDREEILACGMNDVIGKPISVSDMLATIVKWIAPCYQFDPQDEVALPEKRGLGGEDIPELIWSIPGLNADKGLITRVRS